MKKMICLSLLAFLTCLPVFCENDDLNVVFVGNSITFGDQLKDRLNEAPPFVVKRMLEQRKQMGKVQIANLGVCGATTLDYLPENKRLFPSVVEAGDRFSKDDHADLIFMVMLGTNDSAIKGPFGAPVSKGDYKKNLRTIVDALLERYDDADIIINHPLWYSPNTHNGALYLQEGLSRLSSYLPQIDALVKEYRKRGIDRVHRGDVKGFSSFKKHPEWLTPEEGNSGTFYLHPNKVGAEQLARLWEKVIWKVYRD